MGIRLVYGLQTGDAAYLDIFYPSRRLKEATLAAGHDYGAMIFCPSDPPSRILDFCSSPRGQHVALLRGELPDSIFSYLEANGLRVVNPAAAVALARDKLGSAGLFNHIGAHHPRTVLPQQDVTTSASTHPSSLAMSLPLSVSLPESLPLALPLPLPLPFVAKPRYGKMGRGVVLIETLDQWSRYIEEARAKRQETLAQEFIGAATGRDIRFFFARFRSYPRSDSLSAPGNGTGAGRSPPRDWVCVMRRAPGFLSNAHAGGTMEAFSPPMELQREAERIFAASGLVYGTVDFLFANEDGSRFVVCELNANPGFEELERTMNIDVASAIIASAVTGKEGTP
jgi:glutathione synthase/RimK-type ligase-like ATP-grasp enzyme